MAHKQSKATKKFEKNKLKPALERRKDFAKVKQRHKLQAKKKERAGKRAQKESVQDGSDPGSNAQSNARDELNDDKYFQDGVQIPETASLRKGSKIPLKQQTGKRKRSENEGDTEGSVSELEASEVEHASLFDSEENELEDHKGQLDALAQKDPEFYKFLKENDAELLDFNEDDDLAGVDALRAGDEGQRTSKKQKKDTGHREEDEALDKSVVTAAIITTWKKSMSEKHSIRAL